MTIEKIYVGSGGGVKWYNKMPYSEVCCAMGVAGKIMAFHLVGKERNMVQLYTIRDGSVVSLFSFPILPGEAGLLWDDEIGQYYFYPDPVS